MAAINRIKYFGFGFFLEEGGLELDVANLHFAAGYFAHRDWVNSPYSLFISPVPRPKLIASIGYDSGNVFFETRWIELNRRSHPHVGFPDRGANFKTIGWHFGDWRFGFQESAVYGGEQDADESVDLEQAFEPSYFFNPAPTYFVQYALSNWGNPWRIDGNDNAIIGFFLDRETEQDYLYGQVLIDDFSVDGILFFH